MNNLCSSSFTIQKLLVPSWTQSFVTLRFLPGHFDKYDYCWKTRKNKFLRVCRGNCRGKYFFIRFFKISFFFLKICFQCCAKVVVFNKLKCDTRIIFCRFLYGRTQNESFEKFPFNHCPINLNANELCLKCCCMQFKLN